MDLTGKKVMVAYFSTKGRTKATAEKVAQATGGKLFEIQAKEAYTDADIDWRDKDSRCNYEHAHPEFRPELLKKAHCPGQYDVFFIGYPIWYGIHPAIVQTFIETLKLAGKTVVFFATSGSGPTGKAIDWAKQYTKDADKITWADDKLLNDAPQEEVDAWVKSL